MLCRTIYVWNVLAIFATNSYGSYLKPTEGISKEAYSTIKKCLSDGGSGGIWVWLCTSKTTDVFAEHRKDQKSYVYGAVFVAGVLDTRSFVRRYKCATKNDQFRNSKPFDYQMVIPMQPYARLELEEPIEMHGPMKGEQRVLGAWKPAQGAPIYEKIKHARFV